MIRWISLFFNQTAFFLLLIILCTEVWAAVDNDHWKFELSPSAWFINMNGRTEVGTNATHIGEKADDVFKHVNAALSLDLRTHRNRLGIFGNVLYGVLTNNPDSPIHVNTQNKLTIVNAGLSYIILKRCYNENCDLNLITIEPYAGVRYTSNNASITFNAPLNNKQATTEKWTDPFLGLGIRYTFTEHWSGLIAGDFGATNGNDRYSYDAIAQIAYHLQKPSVLSGYLGYRMFGQHYTHGHGGDFMSWKMRLFGPVLGLNIDL